PGTEDPGTNDPGRENPGKKPAPQPQVTQSKVVLARTGNDTLTLGLMSFAGLFAGFCFLVIARHRRSQ
ncbi:MAG: hypothetical protein Q4P66_05825, partial [Actinomycetaceae bacterium]|nr:hypothetical protein [Actinomycetaceae bacterium]